jgi:putative membrane protein
MKNAIVAGAVVLAISAAPAMARDKKQHPIGKQMSDSRFLMDAAEVNMAEVELGKVAERRTSNDEVKNFAKLMVADH